MTEFEVREESWDMSDVRNGGITFKAVTQNVKASTDVDSGRTGISVQRINNSQNGFHRAVGDTGFEVSGSDVQDCSACSFGTSSSSCGNYREGQPETPSE